MEPLEAATITFDDIEKKFAKIPVKDLLVTERFYNGDHWQDKGGWIGWQPPLEVGAASNSDWELIERGFTSKNVIRGIVKRLVGAIFGNEPDYSIVPINRNTDVPPDTGEAPVLTAEEKRWQEIDKIVTRWWSEKNVLDCLKRFIRNHALYGKASLYIYIPKGYLEAPAAKGETPRLNVNATDLENVLSRIFVSTPRYEAVIDVTDDAYGNKYTILKHKKKEPEDEDVYELHYVDPDGKTHIRQVRQGKDAGEMELSVELGGELLSLVAGEFDDALISPSMKQQQRQLNHAKTMEGYAIANINFPETVFINAELETEEKKGADGKGITTVRDLFRGVSTFMSLIGVKQMTPDGGEAYATPDVKYKPAADPEKFAKVAENNTIDMHQEAGMIYVITSSSPYPSGESRVETMTDYLILLIDRKTLSDNIGARVVKSVLRLAFNFTDEKDLIDKFDVIFATKLTLGRVSPEDRKLMLEEVNKRLRSRRNYMIMAGVTDDPTLELKEIAKDPPTVDQQEMELKEGELDIKKKVAERPPPAPAPARQ